MLNLPVFRRTLLALSQNRDVMTHVTIAAQVAENQGLMALSVMITVQLEQKARASQLLRLQQLLQSLQQTVVYFGADINFTELKLKI